MVTGCSTVLVPGEALVFTSMQVWRDIHYALPDTFEGSETGAHDTLMALSDKKSEKLEETWSREEELLDDRWVDQSRKEGRERGSKPMTSHLEGLNWEVLVVNEPVVNAFCLPGGKIVVFTGLLEHFRTDAEIATIIGHEVSTRFMDIGPHWID